jgi:hypothetical protein
MRSRADAVLCVNVVYVLEQHNSLEGKRRILPVLPIKERVVEMGEKGQRC